jgi:hypothetical protein
MQALTTRHVPIRERNEVLTMDEEDWQKNSGDLLPIEQFTTILLYI